MHSRQQHGYSLPQPVDRCASLLHQPAVMHHFQLAGWKGDSADGCVVVAARRYATGILTLVILGVGLPARPDSRLETWAHEEALRREGAKN